MSKALNQALIDGLVREFRDLDGCVLVGTRGLSVAEVTELRNGLRSQNFRMRVIKNTLAAVAFDRTALKGLGARLSGPSAVIYGGGGPAQASKVLVEESKKRKEKLVILGGFSEGEILDGAGVDALSRAPTRQDLLSMTMGAFFGPVSEMARNLDGLFTEMLGLFEALEKKRGEAAA